MMKGIEITYTEEQFKELGFDGEIAKYMRENKNTAIVGTDKGDDNHVVTFSDWNTLRKYLETFKIR